MCKFLSGIVFQSGRIHIDPEHTDSHEDMIAALELKDDREFARDWIRVEFCPEDDKFEDVDAYKLRVDEKTTRVWFDDDRRAEAENYLRDRIRDMIVKTDRKMLLGGCWIIGGETHVEMIKTSRVIRVGDSARIDSVGDSARIDSVGDSTRIGCVGDSARIDSVGGSARIDRVGGSARIDRVWDSARIGCVGGSARIDSVGGSARIDRVWDSARIGCVGDSARIGCVRGWARIDSVGDSARIENDFRTATAGSESK